MPQLPTQNSQRQVSRPGAVSPRVTPLTAVSEVEPVRGLEDRAKQFSPIIEAGGAIIQEWQTAEDTMDYTKYQADTATFLAQQKAQAEVDPDPNNAATYIKNIQEYKKTALGGFRNKALSERVAFELEKDSNIAGIQIGGIFREKQLFQNKIDLSRSIEALAAEKRTSINPTIKNETQAKIDNLLMLNIANGTITVAEAKNLKNLQVKTDILSDNSIREKDSPVLADLRKGRDGPYGYLLENERLEAIKDVQTRIEQNNKNYQKEVDFIQTDNAIGLAESLIKQKLTSMDIQSLIKVGAIDADTARVFEAAISKATVEPKKDPIAADAYLKVFSDNLSDDVTARQIITNATKEWQKGNLPDDEYAYFIQKAQKKLELERKGIGFWDKATIAFREGLNQIVSFTNSFFYPNMAKQGAVEMNRKYMSRVAGGDKPEDAVQEVMKEQISSDVNKAMQSDEYGFVIGEKRKGYEYRGNNQWRKIQ